MTPQSTKAEIADRYGKLPLSFESNEGQTDREVKFLSRGPGYDLYLTAAGAVLTLRKPRPPALTEQALSNQPPEASVLRLKMIGANSQAHAGGADPLPGKINYLIGNDPDKWRVNIPTYRKVYYTEIYPKVDLVYYGNRTELEYDFVVAPGGNVQAIRFQVDGIDRMMLDDAGNLRLAVKQSEVTLRKPVIYQLADKGDRREVKGEYVIKGKEVRFRVGAFDARKPLIIDPVLSYSTLLGGGSNEFAFGIAVDSSGSAYITGGNTSGGFPTTPGAFRTTSSIYGNAFVTKLDPAGTSLVYSTYLNGNGSTTGTAIAVDSSGNAYITGRTSATDFPIVNPIKTRRSFFKTTDGAANWNNNNDLNVDVTALAVAPSAPSTIYAGTFAGPYKSTDGGAVWLRTQTAGLPDFPYTTVLAIDPANPLTVYAGMINGGLYKTINGGSSWSSVPLPLSGAVVFSIVFDPSTPSTIYLGSGNGGFKSSDNGSTWTQLNFGFPATPNVRTIAIDPSNPAIVYAGTFGSGAFKTTNSGSSWTAINSGMVGSFTTYVSSIAIDPFNPSIVYAGSGYSGYNGSINKSTNGGSTWAPVNTGVPTNFQISALLADRTNSQTVYAATTGGGVIKTTNGGSSWGLANVGLWKGNIAALVTDPTDSAILYAGASGGFPDDDAFVSELNASGTALLFSTYLGGSNSESGYGIALDGSGNIVIAGQTSSTNFPAVNAIKSTLSASDTCGDGFVTKLYLAGPSIVCSTYLGGDGCDTAYGVAVDGAGNAYVTGATNSANFPTLNAFQSTIGDSFNGDAFATKLNSNGALAYSTYLGGEGTDAGYGVAADASGNAYITGLTTSISFPLANPIQSSNGGAAGDAFVTKLNSTGSGLIYSTFLGGSGTDGGRGIAVDSAGNAYVAGYAGSADFPVAAGALRTKSPFFQSADAGGAWNNDNYGLKSDIVTALALDPTKPSTIYAGTQSNVYKSTDGGQRWNPSANGLVRPHVIALLVDHATPSTIYLGIGFADFGDSMGVYKSTNGGNTWNAANTGLSNTSVLSLAIDPITPSTLYAGVYGSGVFKSLDGGANWTLHTSPTLSFIEAIVIDPITPATIYAGANSSPGGMFKSTDAGLTWQAINNGLTTSFILDLAIDPLTPSTIYAGANGGVFKSIDGGASWTSINTGLTSSFVNSITIDPVTPTTVYATSASFTGGVFKSLNGGSNWAAVNNGLTYRFVSPLIINPITPERIYVGVDVFPPDDDAFVAKLNPSGTALIYSTLLGGSGDLNGSGNPNDEGYAIALDSGGNAYVAGASRSPDFPVTSNSFQPFNRGFTDAFVSKLTMSYIISGHVLDGNNTPVSGADITLSDGASLRSVVTESDGSYQFSRLREGGNFTVSAAKPHFTMTPTSQSFNNLQSNQTVNFIAAPTNAPFYSIRGSITNNGAPLSGVTVTLSGSQPGIATTNSNGLYSFTLAGGGNYTVTPSLLGFIFTPANQTFNNLSADQTANFAATRQSFVVINVNTHGTGSLRQAMLDANATVGLDTIVFNIPAAGVQTLNLQIALPEITDPVVIDATTQPGYAGTPPVELNGAQTNPNSAGFRIRAGGSTIRGFAIGGFDWGILLNGGSNNVIQGNHIGVDSTGTLIRNNDTGILILNSANNLIGGTNPAARNVISGNGSEGVEVSGPGNQIQGNFIGTNAIGSAALPNGKGIDIGGFAPAINNTIGGTAAGAGNLISGNQTGVNCSSGNVIQGNLIGTNAAGDAAIGNSTGIVAGASTLVGGTVTGARNIISGNLGDGVSIGGTGSLLQGNFIGTNITGTAVLGNGGSGVVAGNGALIGGTTPEARNVISGNGGFGNISLGSNSSGSQATVQGNHIGTDVTGNVALNNPQAGISISSSFNLIGGLTPGARNVISGNRVGIQIGGSINTIQGNIIGLNALGTSPLPNSLAGIRISDSSNNIIGGTETGADNRISFNAGPGVIVFSGTGNSIRGNSIFSNAGLGIDLSPMGVTANDPCDTDSGPNNLQNHPVLVSALSSAGSTDIQGTLNSAPNTSFNVDFYSSSSCDPSGYGEGEIFLGSTTAVTDASCNAKINAILPLAVDSGQVITATATDASGNTSEFSPCAFLCSYQLSASSASFSNDGGAGTVDVICTNGCAWSAASNGTWITITSGSIGSGNGSVAYSVSANTTGNDRTGTMAIAGQTFTVNQSSNPTAVKLESFSSFAYTDGVFLEWKTGLEIENLGFHVYREQSAQRTRITPEIVAGSALIAGDRTRLTAGRVYGWWDAGVADCGSKNVDCQNVSYWLEDIDLDGTRTLHGPIKPRLVGGLPPQQSTAALLSNVGKGEPRISQVSASQGDLAAASSQRQIETQWDLASKPAMKLTIKEEGWYRLTQQELLAAGLDPKVDPRNLQLYLEDEERALLVTGEQDGSFDQNDAIEFYATGQDLPSTDAHIYWLVSGEQPGKRISVVRSEAKPGGATSFSYTVERKEKTIYFASLRNGDAENFFGRVITSQLVEQELALRHLDATAQGDAVLEVALQGVTDLPVTGPDHQVKLTLNGTLVGTMIFDGRQHPVERFSVPQSLLREGDNVVTLVAEGGPSDISLVHHVRITYRHKYTAEQDSLRMTVGESQTIEGFSNGSIRVLDITNASEPQELLGRIEERKGGGFAVTVQVAGGEPRTLMAFTVNRIKHPVSIVANQPSSWHDEDHSADLLIITNREFARALAPLKALRQRQGYAVEAVDIEDIYDEFGFGQKSPGAIKDFLVFAHTSWKQAPRFALFVGDASYDPRNYLGAGDFDFVPSKLIDTTYLETASDDWFADFNDDGLPEMFVGRLPVRTAAEAATVVSKLVTYDSNLSNPPSRQGSVLLVADRNDGFNFEQASQQLRALLPPGANIQEIFRGRLDDEPAKKQLVNAINSGQSIVNYTGHGSANAWRSLFTTSDIKSLTNYKRLPLFVTMTCLNGFFQDPFNESLAAGLLRSGRGGAVAVWASSGLTAPAQQALMNQQMYRLMFAGTASLTIGEITSRAKASVTDGDIRRTWILFGDPTTVLR